MTVTEKLSSPSVLDRFWDAVIERLNTSLDSHIVSAYFKPLSFNKFSSSDNAFILNSPSRFIATQVERSYRHSLLAALLHCAALPEFDQFIRVTLSLPPAITFNVDSTTSNLNARKPALVVLKKEQPRTSPVGLHGGSYNNGNSQSGANQVTNSYRGSTPTATVGAPSGEYDFNSRYTFETYVVGSNNQFCHAAALRVADQPGKSYNPLFIYGGVGLGKTHLLHAIGNKVRESNPNATVAYMSSETFTNELILALRNAKMDEFKNRLRNIEVLLIDDIQFMRGKERTQEEFFHTFNALYNAKRQIVITSDKSPADIPGIEERLQTRFSWGLTADLQAPDFETRVAILKGKASLEGIELDESVAHFIADAVSSNVRELEGALTRLCALSSLQGVPITLDLANNALKPLLQPRKVNVTISDIKKAVALHFGIKPSDMVSKRRTRNLSFPRHIAMYLCRKHTTASYLEIGEEFGGRDHSSVIHSANVVNTKIGTDPDVKAAIDEIERMVTDRN